MGFLFLLKRIGFFLLDNWKVVAAAILVLAAVGFVYRACNKPPKLDEKQIQKAQDAIAKNEREKMLDVLAESDTAEDAIDSSILQVEHQKQEAKKNYDGLTNDELAAELNRRAAQ